MLRGLGADAPQSLEHNPHNLHNPHNPHHTAGGSSDKVEARAILSTKGRGAAGDPGSTIAGAGAGSGGVRLAGAGQLGGIGSGIGSGNGGGKTPWKNIILASSVRAVRRVRLVFQSSLIDATERCGALL